MTSRLLAFGCGDCSRRPETLDQGCPRSGLCTFSPVHITAIRDDHDVFCLQWSKLGIERSHR